MDRRGNNNDNNSQEKQEKSGRGHTHVSLKDLWGHTSHNRAEVVPAVFYYDGLSYYYDLVPCGVCQVVALRFASATKCFY